jgi:hypothetical protein
VAGESPWTFTFTDMRTGTELAQLPLTNVKYSREISGAGKLSGYLPLGEQRVRNQNPWGATRQRRTAVYAERKDAGVRWSGPVVGRDRDSGSQGVRLSAVTWESWLHAQLLIEDLTLLNSPLSTALATFVTRAQTVTDVRLTTENTPTTGLVSGRYYAREIKPILELIDNLGVENGVTFEYRVDGYRDSATGVLGQVFRYGEPRLGRRFEDTHRTFTYPDGGLIDWKIPEDGTGAHNVLSLLGAGSGALQPFDVVLDSELGIDEIASGYPSWMGDFRAQDTGDMRIIWARAAAAMRAGIASENIITGVKLDPELYLGSVEVGDDVALDITHVALQEWPAAVEYLTRVLAEAVTVGDAGSGDEVTVTVGGVA